MPPVPLLLIKEQLLVAHEAHYAGGIHLFNSIAQTLSKHTTVHVFTAATKSLVMHYALTHGLLGRLRSHHTTSEVISWSEGSGLRYHVIIIPENGSAAAGQRQSDVGVLQLPSNSSSMRGPQQYVALVETIVFAAAQLGCSCKYLLDVDSLQHAVISSSSSSSCSADVAADADPTCSTRYVDSQQQQQQQQFMYALIQQLNHVHSTCIPQQQQQQGDKTTSQQDSLGGNPSRANKPNFLCLVQNIHHLPFGPCGTAPRTPQILQAWQQVSGIICVSKCVEDYIIQHVLPLIGLSSDRVYVMHPAAVGAFGKGPWEDLGAAAADNLWGPQQQQQQQWQQRPVVGMLKCSPEKGSGLFLGLAACLPQYEFLAVCAVPQTQAAAAAAGSGLHNLNLIPPDADVSRVLKRMSVVLVPSVLNEAFGLVVIDAMLHGVPVIIAKAGALEEAAAGAAAAVLPSQMVDFPVAAADTTPLTPAAAAAAAGTNSSVDWGQDHGQVLEPHLQQQQRTIVQDWQASRRHWHDRVFPVHDETDYDSWAAALQHVLSGREVYMGFSRQGRKIAQESCESADVQLQQFVQWLSD